MPKTETPQKKYLYCLIRTDQPHQFLARGMGERGDIVNTINYMNLAVVASDTDEPEYNESRRNMMTHTLVLEEVLQDFPILPIRFGTVSPDEESVFEQVLKRRYGGLISEFEEIENRVELGLKAFWFDEIIFEEIIKENATIRHLRDELVGRSPESTYYERIKLGEMIENAMNKKRDVDAEKILSRLRPLVDKTRTNKVITDKMIVNAAFLVNKSKEAAFDGVIQKLDSDMGKRIMFKYVGPVPPYNFVNIIINWDK